jgi:hypothetical protein
MTKLIPLLFASTLLTFATAGMAAPPRPGTPGPQSFVNCAKIKGPVKFNFRSQVKLGDLAGFIGMISCTPISFGEGVDREQVLNMGTAKDAEVPPEQLFELFAKLFKEHGLTFQPTVKTLHIALAPK